MDKGIHKTLSNDSSITAVKLETLTKVKTLS